MASIDAGGRGGARKRIDSEIPLVPFIDLLLCCVMFLLVSAVWNATETMNLPMPSGPGEGDVEPPDTQTVGLHVTTNGYVITTPDGSHVDADDTTASQRLTETHRVMGEHATLLITADDGVMYDRVVRAMDRARGTGFAAISISERAPMP